MEEAQGGMEGKEEGKDAGVKEEEVMAALKEKVRQNWLRSQGWHAPNAGQSFAGGTAKASAEINAQRPNKKRKRVTVGKKRKPRFKPF